MVIAVNNNLMNKYNNKIKKNANMPQNDNAVCGGLETLCGILLTFE